jgi:hypothetical protein
VISYCEISKAFLGTVSQISKLPAINREEFLRSLLSSRMSVLLAGSDYTLKIKMWNCNYAPAVLGN